MGKKSRLKRERRERDLSGINGVLRGLSRDSVQALLEAASASATSNYVLPSVAAGFCAFVQQRRSGSSPAHLGHVAALVEAAHEEIPDLARLEDFVPGDSRQEALVCWAGSLHRILPGGLSQPLSFLEEARSLASVIDPELTGSIGYGLFDAVELVLRRVSFVAQALAPEWAPGDLPDIESVPSVPSSVLAAASDLARTGFQVSECSNPSRAARALDALTVPASAVRDINARSSLGPAIAVKHRMGGYAPVPAGLLMNSIPALMSVLSRAALDMEPALSAKWAAHVVNTLCEMLNGAGHRVVGVQLDGDGNSSVLYVRYSTHQILLLGISASLDGRAMQRLMDANAEALGDRANRAIPTELLERGDIDPGARLEALQVFACPTYPLQLSIGPVRALALRDLLWMLRTASDPSDLWRYARDISDAEEVVQIVAMDEADAWQLWCKNGKSLHVGGVELDHRVIVPGIQLDEWDAAVGLSALERALLLLDLPPASAWPLVDFDESTCWVADAARGMQYRIVFGDVPVALGWGPGEWNGQQALEIMVDGLTHKLELMGTVLLQWLAEAGRDALRVDFVMNPNDDGLAVELGSDSGVALTLHWQGSLQERLIADSAAVEAAAGEALASGAVVPERRSAFGHAWSQTPRSMRMDNVSFGRRSPPAAKAITLRAAGDSAIRRELAVHMREIGVECREYRGEEAKRLDSELIFPWLMNRLGQALREFSPDEILAYALEQFELLSFERDFADRKMELFLGLPDRQARGDQYLDDMRNEIVLCSKYVSLIVEHIMASRPSGAEIPNLLDWEYLLSIASLCVESGYRSESEHLGMADTTIRISERFELEVEQQLGFGGFDVESYSTSWTESTRPPSRELDESSSAEHRPADDADLPTILDLVPELEPVDSALREVFGFGLQAISGLLEQAHVWNPESSSGVHIVSPRHLAEAAAIADARATAEEYRLAIEWLTLTSLESDGIEPWEVERRADRLATRPLVEHEQGIYVLPWAANSALKTFHNYLDDGRLPWPVEVLKHEDEEEPGKVVGVVWKYRQTLNRSLEKTAVEALESSGLVVLHSILPQKRRHYGIEQLSGEIDLLCIDARASTMWVVEVKDPSAAFSPRSVMRIVSDFHRSKGYVSKLLNKCPEIEASATGIAAAQGIESPDRSWNVRGLIATRRVCPAAFVHESPLPFCTVDGLRAFICQ